MAYIQDRSTGNPKPSEWCDQLRIDEQEARNGGFAGVAADMMRAQADYRDEQEANGEDGYPYNRGMGCFLGLPIAPGSEEPPIGYYMASRVMHYFRLGRAAREIKRLLATGRASLRVVSARDMITDAPTRFHTFRPDQIKLLERDVECENGHVHVTLSNDWSVETCFEQVAEALRNGWYYGYDPTKGGEPAAKPLGKKQVGKATVPTVSSSHLA